MTRLIAAIDASAAARPVLAAAAALARLFAAEVEALHVGENRVRAVRAQAEAAGVTLSTVAGPTVAGIVAAAKPSDVVAVVIGARGTPAGRRPVGGTALEVVSALEKPVVVVPPGAVPRQQLRRILVPLDGTAATSDAVRHTIELARSHGLEVVILHVQDEGSIPPFQDQPQHEVETWGREFLARHCPCPPEEVRLELRVGSPPDYVARVAREDEADLIALTWSQDPSPGRAAVVLATLARSPVPVLLVPPRRTAP